MNILKIVTKLNYLILTTALLLSFLWVILVTIDNPKVLYKIIFDFQLLIAPCLAVIGWWFKIIYEKWTNEKKTISELQQIYSHNIDTLPRLLAIIDSLLENIQINTSETKFIHKKFYIEYLNQPTEERIRTLRNIDLLNSIFKNTIFIKRFNVLLKISLEQYDSISEEYRTKMDLDVLLKSFINLREEMLLLKKYGEKLNEEMQESAANLISSGEKIVNSIFYRFERISVYRYTKNDVARNLIFIKKKIKENQ